MKVDTLSDKAMAKAARAALLDLKVTKAAVVKVEAIKVEAIKVVSTDPKVSESIKVESPVIKPKDVK